MTKQLNIAEAKAKLSELVDLAIQGGEVIIARAGKPVARIVPIDTLSDSRANFFGGLAHLDPVPEEALSPEPSDAIYGFDDELDMGLRLVAEPNAVFFSYEA